MVFERMKGGKEDRRGKSGEKWEKVGKSGRFRKWFPGEDLTGIMVFRRVLGGTK